MYEDRRKNKQRKTNGYWHASACPFTRVLLPRNLWIRLYRCIEPIFKSHVQVLQVGLPKEEFLLGSKVEGCVGEGRSEKASEKKAPNQTLPLNQVHVDRVRRQQASSPLIPVFKVELARGFVEEDLNIAYNKRQNIERVK